MKSNIYLDFERPIVELEDRLSKFEDKIGQDSEKTKNIQHIKTQIAELKKDIYSNLTRWQRVQLSRHPLRPYTLDYIQEICKDYVALHGDRLCRDDKAIVGGLAYIDDVTVMIIGQQKGRDIKERKYRNFGMANPYGYRKAMRLMRLAERFSIPVITLIDTPGAFPGKEAEEQGQAEAIAHNIRDMLILKTPIISIVIGEGASGGALGIGVCDRLYMMENTWYSVISPESCSSILWHNTDYKEQAAAALRLAPDDLIELNIADGIIKEPLGGAHYDINYAADNLKKCILENIKTLSVMDKDKLIEKRISRYSKLGAWEKVSTKKAQ